MMLQLLVYAITTLLLIHPCNGNESIRSALQILDLVKTYNALEDTVTATATASTGGSSPAIRLVGVRDVTLPMATISYAQTIDGTIAPLERARLDISSKYSFKLLHSLRGVHDAVLIGINTMVFDQPRLNIRDPLPQQQLQMKSMYTAATADYKQPRPVIIDSELRFLDIPLSAIKLINPIICTCIDPINERYKLMESRLLQLEGGGSIINCQKDSNGKCDLIDCFRSLKAQLGINSILVEGGAGIIQSVLEHRLAYQLVVTIRPSFFGGYRSLVSQLARSVSVDHVTVASIGGDVIMHGLIDTSAIPDSDCTADGYALDRAPVKLLHLEKEVE